MEFSNALKKLRGELGLTQMELANALNVNYATISRWELGKTYPNRSMLSAVMDYAHVHFASRECIESLHQAIADTKRERLSHPAPGLGTVEHTSLSQLIDDASFPIYVSDIETDELLYINHKTEEMLGGTLRELAGKKCYECLMRRDEPCAFCRKEQLTADKFTSFDAFRPEDGTFHRVQGKLIRWNGRKAQVRYITDTENGFGAENVFSAAPLQEETAKKWRQTVSRLRTEEYTIFVTNLSRGTGLDRYEGTLLRTPLLNFEIKSFNERTLDYAGRFVHLDDFDAYTTLVNAENLLAGFYRGRRIAALDYRERVSDGVYRWLRLTVEMAKCSGSAEVTAFLMYELSENADELSARAAKAASGDRETVSGEKPGIALIRIDWQSRRFYYDKAVSQQLYGKYDDRPLWEILMSEKVADTQDIKAMKNLTHGLAESTTRTSGTMRLLMKTPSRASHWFNLNVFKQSNADGATVGLVLTFKDLNDDIMDRERLRFEAEHDALTGLYNRSAFLKLAEETVRGKPADAYVLSCDDINGFRFFNERYGREEGDKLLKYTADKLRAYAEQKDGFVGRLSNDIFALLLPNSPGIMESSIAIAKDFYIDYPLGANISGRAGVYFISDTDMTPDAMLDCAVMASNSIKGKFASWLSVYDESMNERRLRELSITDRMEAALEQGQFVVYIQPQFHHATGKIVGAEALVRWIDPERGVVSPAEFIPVFEKNGFISKMDEYVWDAAASYLGQWIESGNEPVPMSVNVSREDLGDPELCEKLLAIVKKYNVPTDMFRLEITESLFAEDSEALTAVVNKFHDAGFLVEMDDFGSGYSALNILKDVPVDILKLDMKFFSGEDNLGRGGMIVNAVLRMARWLDIPVIAEGVELQDQADFLLSIGCPTIQGYLYERPMPAADFEKMLSAGGRKIETPTDIVETKLDTLSFWNPLSADSQVFNNCIGPAAVFDYHDGEYEIVRMNKRFIDYVGINESVMMPARGLVHFLDEDRDKFDAAVNKAIETCEDVKTRVRCHMDAGGIQEFSVTLRVVARSTERSLVFAAL